MAITERENERTRAGEGGTEGSLGEGERKSKIVEKKININK